MFMSNVEKKVKKKTKMSRINIRISSVLNDWLDEQTRLTGVPKSTICHLAIMNYVQQQQTVGVMADIAKKMEKGEICSPGVMADIAKKMEKGEICSP